MAQLESVLGLIADFTEIVYLDVLKRPKSIRIDYIDTGSRLRSIKISGVSLALALGDVVEAVPDRRSVGIVRAERGHGGGQLRTGLESEADAMYIVERSVFYRTSVIRDILGWVIGLNAARSAVVKAIGIETQCEALDTEDGMQWRFIDSDGRQCFWRITRLSSLLPGCIKFGANRRLPKKGEDEE